MDYPEVVNYKKGTDFLNNMTEDFIRIDTHVHFDTLFLDPETKDNDDALVKLIQDHDIALINLAWNPARPNYMLDTIEYHDEQEQRVQQLRDRYGITSFRGVGVHPKSIPKTWEDDQSNVNRLNDLSSEIRNILDSASSINSNIRPRIRKLHDNELKKGIVAIGEVGIENNTKLEMEVLCYQIAYALNYDLPISIHTPKNREGEKNYKRKVWNKIKDALRFMGVPGDRVVIDHIIDDETTEVTKPGGSVVSMLIDVLSQGYYAGITIGPSKATPEQAAEMISRCRHYSSRIMLNTDAHSRYSASEYEKFANMGDYLTAKSLTDKQIKNVLGNTAKKFFGI